MQRGLHRPTCHRVSSAPDAVIAIPPPSPSDTNPPLGPALIRAEGRDAGLEIQIVDLNIEYIRSIAKERQPTHSRTLGDHGKDRPLLQEAADRLFRGFGFETDDLVYVPEGAHAVAGMHLTNDSLQRRTTTFMAEHADVVDWMRHRVLDQWRRAPAVVGISIMGPSQVFLALVLARAIKEASPRSTVIFGGTHVTLLRTSWVAGAVYRGYVDGCLFGHAEEDFARLVASAAGKQAYTRCYRPDRAFRYDADFPDSQLALYDPSTLTLPVQFSRGCSYGKCTYCTYPAVEPLVHGVRVGEAVSTLSQLAGRYGVARFSLKDSLVPASVLKRLSSAIVECGTEPVEWSVTTKASRALIPLAAQLGDSGLRTVELGIETTADDIQRLIRKRAEIGMIEELVRALVDANVVPVLNLMFGFPNQTRREAEQQLEWYRELRAAVPRGMLASSLNLMEVVRGSPTAEAGMPGLRRGGIAPWAFAYAWNAPKWRGSFAETLREEELRS